MNTIRNKLLINLEKFTANVPVSAEVVHIHTGSVFFIDSYAWIFRVSKGVVTYRYPLASSDHWIDES